VELDEVQPRESEPRERRVDDALDVAAREARQWSAQSNSVIPASTNRRLSSSAVSRA